MMKEGNQMRVFIVLDEDRGYGPSVAGVFASLKAAQEFLTLRSNAYLWSEEGEEVEGFCPEVQY